MKKNIFTLLAFLVIMLQGQAQGSGLDAFETSSASESNRSEVFTMPTSGTEIISTCDGLLYDDGGPNAYYSSYAEGIVIIRPSETGKAIQVQGSYNLEYNADYLYIYNGEGINGELLGTFTGEGGTIPLIQSNLGPLTVQFVTDYVYTLDGFELQISCYDIDENCLPPTFPTSEILSTTEARLDWTVNSSETRWDIEYGPYGFTLGEGTMITVDAHPTIISDLQASTEYQAYIRANCDEGYSDWSVPVLMETACAPFEIPYSQGFERETLPKCWSQEIITGDNDWAWEIMAGTGDIYGGVYEPHSGATNVAFNAPLGFVGRLYSPIFDLSNLNVYLSFWHVQRSWEGSIDELRVYYRNSEEGEWILLASYLNAYTEWFEEMIFLPFVSDHYQIAFEATDRQGYGVGIDDMSINIMTGCSEYYKTDVNLYPNPCSDQVTISAAETMEQVELFDTMGRCVLKVDPAQQQTILNVSDLPRGLYLIKVMTKDRGISVQKISLR